jgi:hypothetical protein
VRRAGEVAGRRTSGATHPSLRGSNTAIAGGQRSGSKRRGLGSVDVLGAGRRRTSPQALRPCATDENFGRAMVRAEPGKRARVLYRWREEVPAGPIRSRRDCGTARRVRGLLRRTQKEARGRWPPLGSFGEASVARDVRRVDRQRIPRIALAVGSLAESRKLRGAERQHRSYTFGARLIVPAKGFRRGKDGSSVVIGSHFAPAGWSRPSAPATSSTCRGLGLRDRRPAGLGWAANEVNP